MRNLSPFGTRKMTIYRGLDNSATLVQTMILWITCCYLWISASLCGEVTTGGSFWHKTYPPYMGGTLSYRRDIEMGEKAPYLWINC